MKTDLICIVCPKGCSISIETNNVNFEIKGNHCKRGFDYAKSEFLHPERVLTTTINYNGQKLLPVKSSKPIPKNLLFTAIAKIKETKISKPIKMGDVIINNILDTGADIIASCDSD